MFSVNKKRSALLLVLSIVLTLITAGCDSKDSTAVSEKETKSETSSSVSAANNNVSSEMDNESKIDKDRLLLGTNEIRMFCPVPYEEVKYGNTDFLSLDLTDKDDVYLYYNAHYMFEEWESETPTDPTDMNYETIFQKYLKDDLIDAHIQYQINTFTMSFDSEIENVDLLTQKLIKKTGIISGEKLTNESENKSPELKFISYTFLQNDKDHSNWENVPVCWMIISECTDLATFQKMDDMMTEMLKTAEWEK